LKILFIGDVMGRSGREALQEHLPQVKEKLKPDVVIVNGENARQRRRHHAKNLRGNVRAGA
jgi:calcineurin-like phosphoesterase